MVRSFEQVQIWRFGSQLPETPAQPMLPAQIIGFVGSVTVGSQVHCGAQLCEGTLRLPAVPHAAQGSAHRGESCGLQDLICIASV